MANAGNEELINFLVEEKYLKTAEIIGAFKITDRADFVLDEFKDKAYENIPLLIGFGQTISQPLTVAFMIELLQPRAGDKIMDVGSGSGWQTAILAQLVGKGHILVNAEGEEVEKNVGEVIAIERLPELAEMAEKNVGKYNFIKKNIVKVISGDGVKGYKNDAPYDKIIAGAAAEGDVPKAWKSQLKIGGRIVSPVGNSIVVIDKIGKNKYNKKEYFGFSFVPLVANNQNNL